MNPPPVAWQAPSTNTVATAIPAAPTRRVMRRRGDSFTIDLSMSIPPLSGPDSSLRRGGPAMTSRAGARISDALSPRPHRGETQVRSVQCVSTSGRAASPGGQQPRCPGGMGRLSEPCRAEVTILLVVDLDVPAFDVAGPRVVGIGAQLEVDGEPIPVKDPSLEARLTLIEHQDGEPSLSGTRRVLGPVAALKLCRLGLDYVLAGVGRYGRCVDIKVVIDKNVFHIAVEPDLGELQWHRGARESDLAGVVMVRNFALDRVRVAREVEATVRIT